MRIIVRAADDTPLTSHSLKQHMVPQYVFMWGSMGKKAILIPSTEQLSFSPIPTGSLRAPSLFDLGDVSSLESKHSPK